MLERGRLVKKKRRGKNEVSIKRVCMGDSERQAKKKKRRRKNGGQINSVRVGVKGGEVIKNRKARKLKRDGEKHRRRNNAMSRGTIELYENR